MNGEYIFIPCTCVHTPPRPPHGRIVHTNNGYPDDCDQGGMTITNLDSADALLEVLCGGRCMTEDVARSLLREMRHHGVPEYIVPKGHNPILYLAIRQATNNTPRWRAWAALMAA